MKRFLGFTMGWLLLVVCARADIITLASFGGANGAHPSDGGSLIQIGSKLYGTTQSGGPSFVSEYSGLLGYGTVFSVPITGGTPTVLASFNGTDGGSYPSSSLIQIGSTLYGTTSGGGAYGDGTVFSVPVSGGTPTVLASFNSTDGAHPTGSLIQNGSTLYGTSQSNGGQVWSVPTTGGTPTTLASLDGYPDGTLIQIGSTLYGTTRLGGTHNGGTLFSVPINGGTPTVLANFYEGAGLHPSASLLQVGSTFYGTTSDGGASGWGTVFSLPITGDAGISVVANFPDNRYAMPGSLIQVGNTLYGMSSFGGAYYQGSVFAITIPVTSTVQANGGYAGTQVTTIGPKPTTATILGGTASSTTAVTLDSALTLGLTQFSPSGGGSLLGDPITLSGTGLDPFVLQMSYNPRYSVVNPYLGWLDENYDQYYQQWVNAVWGNTYNGMYDLQTAINNAHFVGNESYSAFVASIGAGYTVDNYLGYYGYDPAGHTVWAIINHNSGFAPVNSGPSGPSGPSDPSSVPEPGMVGLWLVGGLVVWKYGRKMRVEGGEQTEANT